MNTTLLFTVYQVDLFAMRHYLQRAFFFFFFFFEVTGGEPNVANTNSGLFEGLSHFGCSIHPYEIRHKKYGNARRDVEVQCPLKEFPSLVSSLITLSILFISLRHAFVRSVVYYISLSVPFSLVSHRTSSLANS